MTTRRQRGEAIVAHPFSNCSSFANQDRFAGKVVLVRRGGCTFREKAETVQNHGGVGVVIVNSAKSATIEGERQQLFAMAADSDGWKIRIPVEMVAMSDAMKIIHAVNESQKVVTIAMGYELDLSGQDYYL